MSDLREAEIFDRLISSFRAAAEHCEALAQQEHRIKGQRYNRLRTELALIEGASRQAAMWRGDTRWLPIGRFANECHRRCGNWLRKREAPVLFTKLAENMRMMLTAAQRMKDARTGVRGPIVPEQPKYEPTLMQVRTPGGIILPPGAVIQ